MSEEREPKIAIVGAGPSGLLTALYLQERGYRQVYVLEKLGRVGGLCKTITFGDRSFDLGANYVIPSYTEIRRLAAKYKQKMYSERPFIAMKLPREADGTATYQSLFSATLERDDGSRISPLRLLWKVARYVWLRFRRGEFVNRPSFAGVEHYRGGELAMPMQKWLDHHDLTDLTRVFQLPITMMGYGDMDKTPAIYALKFMGFWAFVPMLAKEVPLIGRFVPWPKRFLYGYQRFFERMAWDIDVHLGAKVISAQPHERGVTITYQSTDQNLNEGVPECETLDVDHLILACPLRQLTVEHGPNKSFIRFDDDIKEFLGQIESVSYCMTTVPLKLEGLEEAKSPLAAIYPVPDYKKGLPYGVAKQWDDTDFAQFYTRSDWPDERPIEEIEAFVKAGVETVILQMEAMVDVNVPVTSFNRWDYFQHLEEEALRDGWYSKLETFQGRNRTFFVGGATNFELIEPIAHYAKYLVKKNFPKRPSPRPSTWSWWTLTKAGLAALAIFGFAYCALVPAPTSVRYPYPLGKGAAEPASRAFWTAFQANDLAALQPADCETDTTNSAAKGARASGESLICRLEAASAQASDDAKVLLLTSGAYLWRVQSGLYPKRMQHDLERAAELAGKSAAEGDQFAPGFQASAQWLLAFLTKDAALEQDAFHLMEDNSRHWMAFQGFIQMEQVSTRVRPGQPVGAINYRASEDVYTKVLAACLFGKLRPSWLSLPAATPINNFVLNALRIATVLNGEAECYDNDPAPFGLEGTYLTAGDMYLKAGDYPRAFASYRNASRSSNFQDWDYKHLPKQRIERMGAFRKKFLEASGEILAPDQAMAMTGQSTIYCVMCHANSGSSQ